MSSFVKCLSVISSVYFSGPTLPIFAEILLDRGVPPLLKYTLVIRCDQKEVQQNRQPAGCCGFTISRHRVGVRVYFSGPTFIVLAEISLDREVPPSLKYTLVKNSIFPVYFDSQK